MARQRWQPKANRTLWGSVVFCLLVVSAGVALVAALWQRRYGGTERGGLKMAPDGGRDSHADLQLAVTAADELGVTLWLQLTNTGSVPLRIDSELVFCVDVTAFSADGTPIYLEAVPDTVRRAPATPDERLLEVEPGESLERRINMREGFVRLTYATGRSAEGRGVARDFPQVYENSYRLPPDARAARVQVDYHMQGGLSLYLGVSPESLGLFTGPLTASVDLSGD